MNAIEYHRRILAAIDSADFAQVRNALHATVQAHKPVPCAPGSMIMDCHGCDAGSHAEWLADAPCSTLDIIANMFGVSR